jgi:acetylglutamate kinase
MAALSGGVEQVRIAPGTAPGVIQRSLQSDEVGTRIVK